MKTRVLITVVVSLMSVVISSARTWQDNPVASQLEMMGSGELQVFSTLKLLSLLMLMTAGVLWLFHFRSAWHHVQERYSKQLKAQLPRRDQVPSLHIAGASNAVRVSMQPSGRTAGRASRLQAALFHIGRRAAPNGNVQA